MMGNGTGRRAVFLDRDGVLNEVLIREGAAVSPRRLEDFRLIRGVTESVRRLRDAGWMVFVTSNQPDLARGHLSQQEHARIMAALAEAIPVVEIAVCPHDDSDRCGCRKPQPGMLLDLGRRHGADVARSVMVGDSWKDMEAGRRAGCYTILLRRSYNANAAGDREVLTLDEAVEHILALGQP